MTYYFRQILPRFIIACFFTLQSTVAFAGGGGAEVNGQIFTQSTNKPAPGLTVILAHPDLGRSVPTTTDNRGTFELYDIPKRTTPYFLEVYWGKRLIHRDTINVRRDYVRIDPLRL